ncbi:rho guanine nucleotide exchange factor 25-like isoform X2 [Panonychus citri]|uniref:rho guanine nucleotide exchange factor 25-like isoform X2 n=1 Tax=Panonychus citri TaxID=50023 RepID=UPI0023076F34|nr:rho guanine nucleotide exchange factor 25-like isoform X2 [Panonychus citri]
MDESVTISSSDSDFLSSSIGSRSVSIERPGIWVWLSDHINKRRLTKKDISDLTNDPKDASPEIIGRSLFYLSSSWDPIEMETDLKSEANDEQSPVESISNWPGSINSKSTSNDESHHDQIDDSDKISLGINVDESKVNLISPNIINSNSRPSSRPVSIQRHSKRSSGSSEGSKGLNAEANAAIEQERYEMRRNRLLQELITTEEDYVRHLASVINGYMNLMKNDKPYPVPDDLRGGKARIVFGNIEAIYEWHRDYMVKEINKCVCKQGQLGPVFKRWLKKLNIYVVYCQNKNKSEFIVQQYLNNYFEDLRLHLGHQLRLPDLLIKPIQRIMKYQLILSNLLKYTQQAGLVNELNDLRSALQYMQAVPKTTNDMMALTRLAGYEGSIMAQGNLISQGILFVGQPSSILSASSSFSSFLLETESPNNSNDNNNNNNHLGNKLLRSISSNSTYSYQFKKRYVFLFDKMILICKMPKGHHAFSEYIYKFHLPMNKISALENFTTSQTKFQLTIENYSINGFIGGPNIVFKATSIDEKEKWTTCIQKILDRQSFFIKALISPIVHQKSIGT